MLYRREGFYVFIGKPYEEFKTKGKDDKIAKKRSANEQNCGRYDKRDRHFFFFLIKARSDEHPQFVKDERGGSHDTCNKGHLDIGKKHLRQVGEDQLIALRHHST